MMKAEPRQLEEDGRLSGARAIGDHVQVRVLETHHLSSIVAHARTDSLGLPTPSRQVASYRPIRRAGQPSDRVATRAERAGSS